VFVGRTGVDWQGLARATSFLLAAERGRLPYRIAVALAALTIVVFAALAGKLALGQYDPDVAGRSALLLCPLVAKGLCWGSSILVGYTACLRVYDRDHRTGNYGLLVARGLRAHYPWARLAASVAAVVHAPLLGATLIGFAVMLAAGRQGVLAAAAYGLLHGVLYTLLFGLVIVPLMLATLGARTRGGGYFALMTALFLPELVAPITRRFMPAELVSLQAAMGAVSAALTPARHAGANVTLDRGAGALVFLLALALATALFVVRRAHASAQMSKRAMADEAPR
jgi:hypothetical protein